MSRILWLVAAAAALAVLPLILFPLLGVDAAFTGADGQAAEMIAATHPDYEPWFDSLWKPPSPEIESLLFALQAALGTGVLAYYIGLRRGLARGRREGSGARAD